MKHVKWPKIGQFSGVRKFINHRQEERLLNGEKNPCGLYTFVGKVKLDGTNAGIRVRRNDDGSVEWHAQSRTRVLSSGNDNYGFGTWAKENEEWVLKLASRMSVAELHDVLVFGEWVGPGVQKRTSCSKIPEKKLCVFAFVIEPEDNERRRVIIQPLQIAELVPEHDDVRVIPWMEESRYPAVFLPYDSDGYVDKFVEWVNNKVAEVEKCDPYVKAEFGVEGLGEGIVFYPNELGLSFDDFFALAFKVKGEKHEEVRQPKPALKDPAVASSIKDFAEMFVTPARCEKGVEEVGEVVIEKTGDFLKWIGNDIKSESGAELEASGLEWKHVAKAVGTTARMWWMKRVVG